MIELVQSYSFIHAQKCKTLIVMFIVCCFRLQFSLTNKHFNKKYLDCSSIFS